MHSLRRNGTLLGVLATGAALISPLALSAPAHAAPAKGFHSTSDGTGCRSPKETAFIYVKGAAKFRVSWRESGHKLHTQLYWNDPSGISSKAIPTWRHQVYWKVTSVWGTKKNLVKVYGFCSEKGNR
ncbi:hypothetical protein [Streptomyces sp. NPDC093589]|uniref:hypothetical protein n=1 Tax=Streptomyces sp. NPDC093589 TaxID=3366043 RepID=UPI0038235704